MQRVEDPLIKVRLVQDPRGRQLLHLALQAGVQDTRPCSKPGETHKSNCLRDALLWTEQVADPTCNPGSTCRTRKVRVLLKVSQSNKTAQHALGLPPNFPCD